MAVRIPTYGAVSNPRGQLDAQSPGIPIGRGIFGALANAADKAANIIDEIDDRDARAEAAKVISQAELDETALLDQQQGQAGAGFGAQFNDALKERNEARLEQIASPRARRYVSEALPQLTSSIGRQAFGVEVQARRVQARADLGSALDNTDALLAAGQLTPDEANKRKNGVIDLYEQGGGAAPGEAAAMRAKVPGDTAWFATQGQLQRDPIGTAQRLGVTPDGDMFRSNANARQIWDRLVPVLGPIGTAGLMSALSTEAPGFDPSAVNPVSGASGIAQWLGDRKTTLQGRRNWQTLGVQLDHLVSELQGSESKWADKMRTAPDLDSAVDAAAGFERNEGWSEGNPRGSVTWAKSRANAESIAGAFGSAQIDPELTKNLSPERLLALRSQAETEVKQLRAENRAALVPVVANHEAAFEIGDTVTAPLTPGAFEAAYGPVQGPQEYAEYSAKRDIGIATAALRTMTEPDIAQAVAAMRPRDPNAADYAVRAQGWANAVTAAGKIMTARAQDPAGFVENTFPAVRQAWTSADLADPSAVAQASTLTLAQQAQVGITGSAAHALPDHVRARMVQTVTDMAPRARAEFLRSLNAAGGSAVLRDLTTGEHALSPMNSVLAALGNDPVGQNVLAKALAAEEQDKGSGRKSVGDAANGVDGLDARVDADMEPVRRVLNASGAPQSTIASLIDAAKLMSYQLYSGDVSAASKRAVEILTADNDIVDEPGSMLALVPKGLGERAQELGERMKGRGLGAPATDIDALRKEALTVNDLQLLAPSVPGESDEARQRATWDRFQAGTWVQAPDNSGVVLTDQNGSYILRRDGTPVALSYDAIRNALPDTTVHVPGRAVPPTVATPRADAATPFVPTPENTGVPADVLQENERKRQEQQRKLQDGE